MLAQRHILASALLALMLGAPMGALAQGTDKLAATFNERYPAEQLPTQPPVEQTPTQPPAEPIPSQPPAEQRQPQTPPAQTGAQPPSAQAPMQRPSGRAVEQPHRQPEAAHAKYTGNMTKPSRSTSGRRAPSRVVVVPRSFLDAGTEVLPGERKFLDYAFPPNHTPMDVVTNTGGRVGWHVSPLPGPFFPTSN
jgi:outer membrane biosynthesis protein TonB